MNRFSKATVALIVSMAMFFTIGCGKEDEGNGTFNGHEYVDLGLPSGTLWATCNVGAETPEGYGDYFAWGETKPNATYTWNTYKYCNGSPKQLTKYCSNSNYGNNGFTDHLTVLKSTDDAATANWGSGWCMPTKKQWKELMSNTTVTWTTQNDVNGRLFTASNGNSLFLPAAGFCYGGGYSSVGSRGKVWSSWLGTDAPYDAWDFSFDTHQYYVDSHRRDDGLSVRPVRSSRQK